MKQSRLRLIFSLLSFLGILVAAYLVYQHYKPAGGSFCNIGDYVNCDIVNKSIYSEIFGIPVAALGMLAYGILFAGSMWMKRNIAVLSWLLVFAGLSLALSLYLTFVEFFVLRAVCMFCITQQILIIIIFITLIMLWLAHRKSSS